MRKQNNQLQLQDHILQELKNRPATPRQLLENLDGGMRERKEIIQLIQSKKISLKPMALESMLVLSLLLLFLAQFSPVGAQILSWVPLFLLPYYWWKRVLASMELEQQLTIGLVIAQILFTGIILGYLSLLSREFISLALLVVMILQYLFLKYKL